MSSVSMTYIKYRAGGTASWNTDVSNITAPLIAGWPSGSTLYGTLYRLSVTVSSGYTVTKLTFNIPQIRSYSSTSADVYAAVYNHDPSDEFSGQSASTKYISTGHTSTSINSSSPDNLKVTVSGLSIGSSGTYYVFISSTASSSTTPYMYLASQSTQLSCSATHTKNLTPATNITVSSTLYMNSQATISWTPYTSGYKYKVAYKFTGQSSVTNIATSVSSSSCTWTPPASLGSKIPNSTSGTVTIYVYSYEGSTQVGNTCSANFTLNLPTSGRQPVCSSGWASSDYTAVVGHCVAGYSAINVTINSSKVSGSYGATIASIVASCNSQTRTTTGSLGTALQGNNIVSIVATDSRGYSTTYSNTIVGEKYTQPSFTSITLIRCDDTGTESTNGTYYAVTPVVSYTSLSGDNSLAIQTRYKLLDGGSYSSPTNLTNNTKGVAGGGNIATASSYLIEISTYDSIITDSNKVVQTRILTNTSVAATLNLAPNGISAAFFGLADNTAVKKLRVHGEVSSETMTIDSPLPITSGGTGGTSITDALQNLGAYNLRTGTQIEATAADPKDLNDYTTPGVYYSYNAANTENISNTPTSAGFKLVVMYKAHSGQINQILFQNSSYNIYMRYKASSTWYAWKRLLSGSPLAITDGGTGATTAEDARANLGVGFSDFSQNSVKVPDANISAASGTSMTVKKNNLYYSMTSDGNYFSLRGQLRVGGGSQASGWSGFTITGLGVQPSATRTVPCVGFIIQGDKPLGSDDFLNYTIYKNGNVKINFYQYGDGASKDYSLLFFGHLEKIK